MTYAGARHARSSQKLFWNPFSLWLWTYLAIKVRGANTCSAVQLFGKSQFEICEGAPAPTPDVATLPLHFILFSASLTAWQNFNPVHSAMLFSQRYFCRFFFSLLALFLVKSSWQALIILIHAQTTLTCVSLPWLRYHYRAQWLAWFCLWLHR